MPRLGLGLGLTKQRRRAAAPTPADVTGLLAFWRDGVGYFDDTARTTPTTLAQGNTPASWLDTVGSYAFEQSNADHKLKLKASANGKWSLTSDLIPVGGGAGYQGFSWPAGLSIDRRNCTLVFVLRPNNVGQHWAVSNNGPGLTDMMVAHSLGTGVSGPARLLPFDIGQPSFGTSTCRLYCDPSLIGVGCGPASIKCVVDSQSDTKGFAYGSGSVTGGALMYRLDPGYACKGELHAVLVYDHPLTSDEWAILRTWQQANYVRATPTKQVVTRGDSLTEGANTTLGRNWPNLMVDDELSAGWRLWQQGVSATRCEEAAADIAANTAVLYDAAMAKNVYCHWYGTNDLGQSSRTAAQLIADTTTVLTAMRNAGFTTVVGTVANRDGSAGWDGTKEGHRLTYNAALRSGGSLASLVDVLVDFQTHSDIDDPNGALRDADHLHYTQAGSVRLSEIWGAAVAAA